jgi:hypothetical protein
MSKATNQSSASVIELAAFKTGAHVKRARSFASTGVPARRPTDSAGIQVSDEALIRAIGRGDRHAMAELYARHHVRVYRFAVRLTEDKIVAEDIVSDVFLDVWRQADAFAARAEVSTQELLGDPAPSPPGTGR